MFRIRKSQRKSSRIAYLQEKARRRQAEKLESNSDTDEYFSDTEFERSFQTQFDDLNDDCLKQIFLYLRLEELIQLKRLSQRLSRIVDEFLREEQKLITFGLLYGQKDLSGAVLRKGSLSRSELTEIGFNASSVRRYPLKRIIPRLVNVKKIKFHYCALRSHDLDLIYQFPKLESLEFCCNKWLNKSDTSSFDFEWAQFCVDIGPQLKSLVIEDGYLLRESDGEKFRFLLSCCRDNLEKLSLLDYCGTFQLDDALREMKNLKEFKIRFYELCFARFENGDSLNRFITLAPFVTNLHYRGNLNVILPECGVLEKVKNLKVTCRARVNEKIDFSKFPNCEYLDYRIIAYSCYNWRKFFSLITHIKYLTLTLERLPCRCVTTTEVQLLNNCRSCTETLFWSMTVLSNLHILDLTNLPVYSFQILADLIESQKFPFLNKLYLNKSIKDHKEAFAAFSNLSEANPNKWYFIRCCKMKKGHLTDAKNLKRL